MKSNYVLSFLLFIMGYAIGRIDTLLGFLKKRKLQASCPDEKKIKTKKTNLLLEKQSGKKLK